MVDVDGNLVKSTADKTEITYEDGTKSSSSNVDLFWALRGGGGGTFGVVTDFVLKIHQPPSQVVKFSCTYANANKGTHVGRNLLNGFHNLIKNKPSEWGGFVLLMGNHIIEDLFGSILFILNHYGVMSDEAKAYLEPLYSTCDNVNFTTYDTFYEYQMSITAESLPWTYVFSTFMSVGDLNNDWIKFVAREMADAPTYGALFSCIESLIGGKSSILYVVYYIVCLGCTCVVLYALYFIILHRQ